MNIDDYYVRTPAAAQASYPLPVIINKMSSDIQAQSSASSSLAFTLEQSEIQVKESVVKQGDFGIAQIEKIASELLPLAPNEEERNDMARQLEQELLQMVKSQIIITDGAELALRELQGFQTDDDETDVARFVKRCEEITARTNRLIEEFDASLEDNVLVKKHPIYLRVKAKINRVLEGGSVEGGDHDESVGEEQQQAEATGSSSSTEHEVPTIDPITKRELKDPVRNKKCGHIYGKASIAELILSNENLRCPIPGCSNADFIQSTDLATDRKLTLAVQKKQKAKKNQH